jgi:hypothetical protein
VTKGFQIGYNRNGISDKECKKQEDKNMSVVNDLILESNGVLDFGNYELEAKTKKDGFEYRGDIYKIKTFKEITKLERNGLFVYESVPGTAVHGFVLSEEDVSFVVEGTETSSITLELEPETDYKIHIDNIYVGKNKTNLGGKLSFSVDLVAGTAVKVDVKKALDWV